MVRQKLRRFPELERRPKSQAKKGTIIAKQKSDQFIPIFILNFSIKTGGN
jgi:hypothetical protein